MVWISLFQILVSNICLRVRNRYRTRNGPFPLIGIEFSDLIVANEDCFGASIPNFKNDNISSSHDSSVEAANHGSLAD